MFLALFAFYFFHRLHIDGTIDECITPRYHFGSDCKRFDDKNKTMKNNKRRAKRKYMGQYYGAVNGKRIADEFESEHLTIANGWSKCVRC